MLIAERHSRLQELLARKGMSDLETLSTELGVSQSTVRRDVEHLEQRDLVRRTHGGVVWIGEKTGHVRPYAFEQRLGEGVDAKQLIARAARSLVQPGQTVLIDGGTTTFYLAQELLGLHLQLVTNSLPIANLFLDDDNIELILTGGLMYPRYGVLLGPMAEASLAEIHTKTVFLSVAGIHDGMLYNQNMLLVQSERQMMKQSQQVILLVDAGKFGRQALAHLCRLDEIDVVVSDDRLPEPFRKQVRDAGCELVIASEER